jgi:hypothetical protein
MNVSTKAFVLLITSIVFALIDSGIMWAMLGLAHDSDHRIPAFGWLPCFLLAFIVSSCVVSGVLVAETKNQPS